MFRHSEGHRKLLKFSFTTFILLKIVLRVLSFCCGKIHETYSFPVVAILKYVSVALSAFTVLCKPSPFPGLFHPAWEKPSTC